MHHGHKNVRAYHEAVKEPISQRVWILGGSDSTGNHADYIKALAFSSNQKLKVLALEYVVKNFEKFASEIKGLPPELQLAVEERAQRKYVIS